MATLLYVHVLINGGGRDMVTSLIKWPKSEMQDVIRFLSAKGSSPTEFHDEIVLDMEQGKNLRRGKARGRGKETVG